MKVCVTAKGSDLQAAVDRRFGRCQYFLFVDTEDLSCKAVENPFREIMGGAGIQAGQLIAKEGAQALLTGNVGPNAFDVLSNTGVDIYTDAEGTVKEAVRKLAQGNWQKTESASVGSKFGLP